ncbi:MAG TPA: glycosyl transferase family 90 [Kiritimatiellia bacterium]|nr:glycosyl transferase family 90 [Kiritimatiellia bacterium]HMO98534.1 glycosyl transferase family 90 [Kiritimatiellia bacterium]HMP96980.1 glycosyl transferase family 90 [Kiritimatiellia bacterium]
MKSIVNVGQKNSRLLYYAKHVAQLLTPAPYHRSRLDRLLRTIDPETRATLQPRVDYYNRLTESFALPPDAHPLRFSLRVKRRNYHMDLFEFTRCFDPTFRIAYQFGDITETPPYPAVVKARPIAGDNRNAVLFNLNKVRHFVFVDDPVPFEQKRDLLVWRGNAFQENRKRFLARYHRHPLCDVGHAHKRERIPEWQKPYLSIRQQLDYKFILSLEGNDVASNLKWIMASQSLCFMPRPRYETWFMEGTLVPDHHYVALADDFSDLEEKINYYRTHPEAARAIIANAQSYVTGFWNPEHEALVALLVLNKYFMLSGQRIEN